MNLVSIFISIGYIIMQPMFMHLVAIGQAFTLLLLNSNFLAYECLYLFILCQRIYFQVLGQLVKLYLVRAADYLVVTICYLISHLLNVSGLRSIR